MQSGILQLIFFVLLHWISSHVAVVLAKAGQAPKQYENFFSDALKFNKKSYLMLKSAIFKEDKKDVWKILNDENLTMITVEEDNSSAITTIEAKEYLSSDKSPDTGNGDANGDDLLDDL